MSLARCHVRGYREGEQAYISYGLKSNDELLQFYGFVEADCPADTYVLVRLLPRFVCVLRVVDVPFVRAEL